MDFPAPEIKQGIPHGLSLPPQEVEKNPDGHLSIKPSPCKNLFFSVCAAPPDSRARLPMNLYVVYIRPTQWPLASTAAAEPEAFDQETHRI
jgi:hypothetical protein